MPLPCYRPLDMMADRGRVLPLGGPAPTSAGFSVTQKAVDTPNAYIKFSRRTPRSTGNPKSESALTPRHGAMSATGEIVYRGGRRSVSPTPSNDGLTPRGGKFITGVEARQIADRIFAEDHPRRMVVSVPAPVRPAVNADGLSPFITANGMVGKFVVSPCKGQKNAGTTNTDIDTKNSLRRQAIDEHGQQPGRYGSPWRAVHHKPEQSPIRPDSLPLHPEIAQAGLAKAQRFAPSRRHEPSLYGVLQKPTDTKPPPAYKLVAPFHTTG